MSSLPDRFYLLESSPGLDNLVDMGTVEVYMIYLVMRLTGEPITALLPGRERWSEIVAFISPTTIVSSLLAVITA